MANPTRDEAFHQDLCFELEVRCVTRKTSDNYVVNPTIDEIESDLLIGLKRFKHSVRVAWQRAERKKQDSISPRASSTTNQTFFGDDEPTVDDEDIGLPSGLGTNLRPTKGGGGLSTDQGSREVEGF